MILIIEENVDILQSLSDALELNNYRVIGAVNAEVGIREMETHANAISLIILDWIRQGMGPHEFMEAKRGNPHTADIPVLLTSAGLQLESAARNLGIVATLAKPMKIGDLLEAVTRYSR